jgi:hypothetical protein
MYVTNGKPFVFRIEGITLLPGVNTIEKTDFARIKKHPRYSEFVKAGLFTVECEETITETTITDAVALVQRTWSIPELEQMKKAEPRKKVQTAIAAQISVIKKKEEKPDVVNQQDN